MKHIQSRLNAKSTTTSLGNVGTASTHIMKRRTNNTYKVATPANDPQGFSLNGTTRNISVGKNYLFSEGPSCCTDNSNKVKPSVINTKGMLANRFRWKKTPVAGFPTLETIYNRWVSTQQTGYVQTGTASEYIQETSKSRGGCQENKNLQSQRQSCNPNSNFIKNVPCTENSCGTRIEQKRNYPENYTKFNIFIKDASDANINAIRRRAGKVIEPRGLNKPFPFNTSTKVCNALIATQSTDPVILKTYFNQ